MFVEMFISQVLEEIIVWSMLVGMVLSQGRLDNKAHFHNMVKSLNEKTLILCVNYINLRYI